MINYYKNVDGGLVQLDKPEKNCWINVYPPFDHENLRQLGEEYKIPFDYLIDSLDVEERARFERDDDIDLIVLKTPILNPVQTEAEPLYLTIPIGIILARDVLVTITAQQNPVIDSLLNMRTKAIDPNNRPLAVLKLFEKNVYYFIHYLNEINGKRNLFERELYNSLRNKELKRLLDIEKSLVYFVTSLRSNELLMMKIQRLDFLEIANKEDENDLLQDILVENSQASEMANIYANILSGTMDAFASIISNNVNMVVKRLTSVTIVLMVPTLVASFFGMNVKLPMNADSDFSFWLTVLISLLLSIILIFVFLKKRWF